MSEIDNGIRQPLRFYDSVSKQDFRRDWVINKLNERELVINPNNTIIPFQIRRRRSPLTVTVFDLYKWDELLNDFSFYVDVLSLIPAPETNHLRVVQMTAVDNIIWYPVEELTADLDCGFYYIHISDSALNWYSEVFAVKDFAAEQDNKVLVMSDPTVIGVSALIKDAGNNIVISHKIF